MTKCNKLNLPLWLSVCSHPLCPDELHPAHVDKPSLPKPAYDSIKLIYVMPGNDEIKRTRWEISKPEKYKQRPMILEMVQTYLA